MTRRCLHFTHDTGQSKQYWPFFDRSKFIKQTFLNLPSCIILCFLLDFLNSYKIGKKNYKMLCNFSFNFILSEIPSFSCPIHSSLFSLLVPWNVFHFPDWRWNPVAKFRIKSVLSSFQHRAGLPGIPDRRECTKLNLFPSPYVPFQH